MNQPRISSVVITTIATLALASVAEAAPIFSRAGGGDCMLGAALGGGSCTVEQIAAHPLWQEENPRGHGAVWVSYADTGIDGSTLAPRRGSAQNPDGQAIIMTLSETFTIGEYGGHLDLMIWADDTARVYVDGDPLIEPVFAQGVCAASAIGCEPDEYGFLDLALAAGDHTLTIELFQVGTGSTNGSNPFGVLYSGEAVSNPIPEPSAALAFGVGLIAISLATRRPTRRA